MSQTSCSESGSAQGLAAASAGQTSALAADERAPRQVEADDAALRRRGRRIAAEPAAAEGGARPSGILGVRDAMRRRGPGALGAGDGLSHSGCPFSLGNADTRDVPVRSGATPV